MMSIVTTGPDTGYYADVFRSRKERGGDKMHDYFYHNLGQSMTLTAVDGTDMNLQPTEELAFAGADLYAYSYLYDNVNSKACISLRIHVNITRKRNALQRTFSSRRAFLLVRVRFILLFYLDDVIIQIADSFLQAIVHQTKSGVVNNHEIHRSFTIFRS